MIGIQHDRGLTLVETLLALTLLSALVIAGFGWLSTVAGKTRSESERLNWLAAADATLSRIHDDVVSGDFGERDDHPRLTKEAGGFRIRTRRPEIGATEVIYRFESSKNALSLVLYNQAETILISDLRGFRFDLIDLDGESATYEDAVYWMARLEHEEYGVVERMGRYRLEQAE